MFRTDQHIMHKGEAEYSENALLKTIAIFLCQHATVPLLSVCECVHCAVHPSLILTPQSRQFMPAVASTAKGPRHGRVVQILIHFTTVLLILFSFGLLQQGNINKCITPGTYFLIQSAADNITFLCREICKGGRVI